MARKFEIKAGWYGWNLETCEEEILIVAYDEICRFIPNVQKWKTEFEKHFFDLGSGVAVVFLDSINAVRRRRGLSTVVIRETDVYDYARSLDKRFKSDQRRRLRDELNSASPDVRQRRIELAKAEAERLPHPQMTHDEHKAQRQRQLTESALSFAEVKRRVLAEQAASAEKTKALTPEHATRMLSLASSSLWGEIIPKLSAEDALVVAEKITDSELRDALVKHSLGVS